MGEAKRKASSNTATYEPKVPLADWPHSHVAARVTPPEIYECIEVEIHGRKHYLHSTTAAALAFKITQAVNAWASKAQAHSDHIQLVMDCLQGDFTEVG